MNRIGWFVVCLVATFAVQSSQGNGTTIKNRGDFKSITKLKPVPEIPDPDVAEIRNFFDDLLGNETEIQGRGNEGRTFGQKRIQFMMMAPMMYKMGVMMTMLAVLTVISLKGLAIGVFLLMLKMSSLLAKFHMGWHGQGHGQAWPQQPQPVHVHVHGDGYHPHNQGYSHWPSAGGSVGEGEQHYYYRK